MTEKFLPINKPDFKAAIENNTSLSEDHKKFIQTLSEDELSDMFFAILQDPKNVSQIAGKLAKMGFSENNMAIEGETSNPGDHISISRWSKAATGSLIIPTRYDENGELEILCGKKRDLDAWVLPGGHYDLDLHKNLEHTLIAELMEETGIILLSDKFLPAINLTIEHQKDILPYNSIEEADDHFISEKFSWNLEAIISGARLGYKKRIVLAAYRVHFHDGAKLKPIAADDLEEISWFKIRDILPKYSTPQNDKQISLDKFPTGQFVAIRKTLERIKAMELSIKLSLEPKIEDLDYNLQYLKKLKSYAAKIEELYSLEEGVILNSSLTGPDCLEYTPRMLILHDLEPELKEGLYKLHPNDQKVLNLKIEKLLINPILNK